MRRVVFFITFLLLGWVASAAPVENMPVWRVQPQGDTLFCFVSGDEFFHRLHDAEGYTIVQNQQTGEYVYATKANGLLVPTAYKPGNVNPATVGLNPGLMPDVKELKRLHEAWAVPEKYQPLAPKSTISMGTLNNLVVFVRFSDESSCTSTGFSTIDAMFNDSTAGANSMYNYFWKSSYHNLRVVTHYYPTPSGNTILSYQDSHSRGYFQPYSSINTGGYVDSDERRNREFQLIQDAVTWVNTNAPVSTSLNLDMDNDGTVDNICFVVSGTYTDWNDLLWPHKWSLYDRYVYINSKRVYTFNLQLAGSGDHYFSASTFCHEMTHTLGCPDIYNYYEYTSVTPAGSWDLMCGNQTPPQQTNSLFKFRYLDWLDSIPQLTDTGTYTMQSNASGPNHAYKIASPNRNEWYILEYRNTADTFDSSIPNRGMLIWRYNSSTNASNASFDFTTTPHELWLFRPGSHNDTTTGIIAQAGFGLGGRTSFGSGMTNYPFLCDGTVDTTFYITNIQLSSDYSSVSFTFTPRVAAACGTVRNFPLTQGFEDGTTGCWSVATASAANDGRVGVYDNATSSPHTGSYSFRFSSYATASDYNQYLISPKLSPANPLHLQFYYKKSNTANEHFMVKYSTTGCNMTDFTDTICNVFATSTSWQLCDVLVPQAAKYVAIDYCSDYLYYLYIDDISLTDTLSEVLRDTTYIHVHDTITTWIHDTVNVTLYDTVHVAVELEHGDTILTTVTVLDTSYISQPWIRIQVLSHDGELGAGVGNGVYRQGDMAVIGAKPYAGNVFDHWMDGTTDNPREVTVTGEMNYVAYFVTSQEVDAKDDPMNTVHDTLVVHDTVFVTQHVFDTVYGYGTIYVYDTILVTLPTVYDTMWDYQMVELDTVSYFTLEAASANLEMGWAIGGGEYALGTVTEVAALPFEGYRFLQWSDGVADEVRSITVSEDITLEAIFAEEQGGESIQPIEGNIARVYATGATLVVEAQQADVVNVYNTLGQLVVSKRLPSMGGVMRIEGLPAGFYAVQVGCQPAQKVMLMK